MLVAETVRHSPKLKKRLREIRPFIGNTPLFPLSRISPSPGVRILAKLEWQQLGGSVKARPAFRIIESAIEEGSLSPDRRLLDATSGNTGIAYAAIGAALGISVTLCLPENASEERKQLLQALGAEVVYTSRFESTDGAQEKARELVERHPERYFYADQYNNPANWKAHYYGTAEEIYHQTKGRITHFVAGLGTTGTFVGTGRRLKELVPGVRLIALQPDTALHGLEGWKHLETARVPGIYDPELADAVLSVDTAEAHALIRRVAREEGLLLSPSSAANLVGAMKVAREIERGVVVTVFPDNADKYGEILRQIFG